MNTRRAIVTAVLAASILLVGLALYLRSDAHCARDRECWQLLRLEQLVHLYILETGSKPSALQDLFQLNTNPSLQTVRPSYLIDAWGHPIVFASLPDSPRSFRLAILSAQNHPDGSGPAADIVRESHLK